jgi:hypothetical protein
MKKTLLITGVLLALTATAASAASGVNLFWNDCFTGANGVVNKSFACTSNVGQQDMYVSVDPPVGVVNTNGHNHIIDLMSASSPLPAWWDFKNTGTCRINSLLASGDFSVSTSGGIDCPDPWSGTGNAGVAAYTKDFGGDPRRARIIGSVAYSGPAVAMDNGIEYYSIRFRINNVKTVGTGLCAGCLDPVCLVLNQVRIAQPAPDPTFAVENPRDGNFVTWQGGAVGGPGCPGATPATNSSWGKVKSLYR